MQSKRIILIGLFISIAFVNVSWGQSVLNEKYLRKLQNYFLNYHVKGDRTQQYRMTDCRIDDTRKTVTISTNEYFAAQEFTRERVDNIYKKIRKLLPKPYDKYRIRVVTNGMTIDQLITYRNAGGETEGLWGDIEYKGEPWVRNVSKPNYAYTHGLYNRHLAIYASHGRFFDAEKGKWRWQRPNLFCTNEDLFTQTIVVPYLIPMLEHAGATVYSVRERDWQPHEVIIDNDGNSASGIYNEYNGRNDWKGSSERGFGWHSGTYQDNENPFVAGTARMCKTTKNKNRISLISYKPNLPEAGRYAVYVSYQTVKKSVENAEYIVYHKGQATRILVNQRMGSGTWVYLGTFEFDKGQNDYNRVMLTNYSNSKGVVTADAVRFGGGMGNIQRGGQLSGFPRALEGARYSAQWAGAPYSVYSSKGGKDDYSDDINVRSYMTNWLAGGSVYVPTQEGKGVPLELQLAVHSDAGFEPNGTDLVGTLAICTTNFNDGLLSAGISRQASKLFAKSLLENTYRDLKMKYKRWNKRYLWDRNYSETRNPEVPSAILETLSHQNFPDMLMAQDPNFRFTLARSVYKTILRYVSAQHSQPCVVQPLQPENLRVRLTEGHKAQVEWSAQRDPQEPTAQPDAYNVYVAAGTGGFDNGTRVNGTHYELQLEPHVVYQFKVTAVNRGGESFPSEVVSTIYHPGASQTILVVNGFHRLSAPQMINKGDSLGFDLDADPGVSYGLTAGWNGRQTDFDRTNMGKEGPGGLGYGGDELAGHFVAGNDFNYTYTHTTAIASAAKYNVVSCSSKAVENGLVKLTNYDAVDLILGLERYTGYSLEYYKSFTPELQKQLQDYVRSGRGRLLVSGCYIGSDMTASSEQSFLSEVLKVKYQPTDLLNSNGTVNGLGMSFDYWNQLNPQHYAATHAEILHAIEPAFCAMQYADGTSAAVAYKGSSYRCLTMGFPFECIKSASTQSSIMRGLLNFLMN